MAYDLEDRMMDYIFENGGEIPGLDEDEWDEESYFETEQPEDAHLESAYEDRWEMPEMGN
jgi:hypothetical protein